MSDSNGNKLALFGERDELREMADRLKKLMPGTTQLTEVEALSVAQVAVAHNLDPFNGEVWGLKGENGKWYGVMVGIKGLRRHARIQAEREGTTYWTEFIRIQPQDVGAPENSVAYKCVIRDTVQVQAWGKSINILTTSGVPYQEAIKMLGKSPETVGIGIAKADEYSKMPLHQRARKRAEADATRQRFDVDFGGASIAIDQDEPIDSEYTQAMPRITVVDEELPPNFDEIVANRSEEEILHELGF